MTLVPAPASRRRWAPALGLALILAASLVPRVPVLHNAPYYFNSDEAVNALVVKHMLERGDLTLYNWDATYYGIVEGLLAIPFVWLDGYTPLAFKLAAVTGFLLAIVAVFLLGRRLYGTAAGLWAAALLAIFSPHVVLWSTVASGGYLLLVAWGTLTVLAVDRASEQAPRMSLVRLAAIGFLIGFGLYLYELFLVYVASTLLWAASLLVRRWWRRRRSGVSAAPPEQLPRGRGGRLAAGSALLLLGLAIGWSPKIYLLAHGDGGSKRPSYALAKPEVIARNVELLTQACAPALLGVGLKAASTRTAPPTPATQAAAWLVVAFYGVAWAWGARRAWSDWRDPRRERLTVEGLLVLHVPLVALLFVLSPNPSDALSDRYLLPWITALVVLAGGLLARLAWRARPVAVLAGSFLLVVPAIQVARQQQLVGYLGDDLRLRDRHERLYDVVAYLKARGIRAANGPYWVAYEGTFLSGEELVFAPWHDWDRFPEYTRRVQAANRDAWVFGDVDRRHHRHFRELLAREGRTFEVATFGPYTVYTTPHGRVLPRFMFLPPEPLTRHEARLEALDRPAIASTGSQLEVPLRVTNTGAEPWSRDGVGPGTYRVAVAYRWLDAAGVAVVVEGHRTLLPTDVGPGESVEVRAQVTAPDRPGELQLRLTLVQEGVAWFDQANNVGTVLPVRVVAGSAVAAASAPPSV